MPRTMRNGYIKGLRAEQDRSKAIAEALNSGTAPVQVERPNVVRAALRDNATCPACERDYHAHVSVDGLMQCTADDCPYNA